MKARAQVAFVLGCAAVAALFLPSAWAAARSGAGGPYPDGARASAEAGGAQRGEPALLAAESDAAAPAAGAPGM